MCSGPFVAASAQPVLYVAIFWAGIGITGLFAGIGPFTAELVPGFGSRGLAMGIAYNGGRLGGILAPCLIGALATSAAGFQLGMGTNIAAFLIAATQPISPFRSESTDRLSTYCEPVALKGRLTSRGHAPNHATKCPLKIPTVREEIVCRPLRCAMVRAVSCCPCNEFTMAEVRQASIQAWKVGRRASQRSQPCLTPQ